MASSPSAESDRSKSNDDEVAAARLALETSGLVEKKVQASAGKSQDRGLYSVSRARLLAADEVRRVGQQLQLRGSELEAFRGVLPLLQETAGRHSDAGGKARRRLGARRVVLQCGRWQLVAVHEEPGCVRIAHVLAGDQALECR